MHSIFELLALLGTATDEANNFPKLVDSKPPENMIEIHV
jgi:hypothetical protein